MGVPELDLARVQRWAEQRVPGEALDQVRVEVQTRGKSVTVVERRAPWRPEAGPEWSRMWIAQLRCDPGSSRWTLYWANRNGRWHRYDTLQPQRNVQRVIDEIDEDPTAIFWG
ncbi:MAG: DUF3024 domain-containing protein [Euzebyaceae bacterium]|nr:DUF3024 domain-containing protein [Euzebyaceae bacterium]